MAGPKVGDRVWVHDPSVMVRPALVTVAEEAPSASALFYVEEPWGLLAHGELRYPSDRGAFFYLSEIVPHPAAADAAEEDLDSPHSQAFYAVLDEMRRMHNRKGADYGQDTDPYANVRGSVDFGVKPWVGALLRGNDKMRRLQKAAQGGTLVNEGIEDSLIDLAVYAVIALVLFREETS